MCYKWWLLFGKTKNLRIHVDKKLYSSQYHEVVARYGIY